MKFLSLIFLMTSLTAQAGLSMKPGLWGVAMVVSTSGKQIDPSAEMKKAMAGMPADQKKKMQEMMKKMGAPTGIGENGDMQVCYSEGMLKNPGSLVKPQDKQKCDAKVVEQSDTKVVTNFKCEDGTTGEATWSMSGPEKYHGLIKMKSPKRGATEINSSGKFISSNCGNVKPLM